MSALSLKAIFGKRAQSPQSAGLSTVIKIAMISVMVFILAIITYNALKRMGVA